MATVAWYQQNEDTTSEGFLLDNEAALRADMALFAAEGAPDTDAAVLVAWEAEDRDEAIIEATVSDALALWLQNNDVPIVD